MYQLIKAATETIVEYVVTPIGVFPYDRVNVQKFALYKFRDVPPVGPDVQIIVPIDVFVEIVCALKGYYTNFPNDGGHPDFHQEVKHVVLAILWARDNAP